VESSHTAVVDLLAQPKLGAGGAVAVDADSALPSHGKGDGAGASVGDSDPDGYLQVQDDETMSL